MSSDLQEKYPLFLPDFNGTLTLSTSYRTILKYQSSWQLVQREISCSTQTDERMGGQTRRS